MKNIKFSRLFAAALVVACLALTGCKQPEEESSYAIEGTWLDPVYGQKFEITHNELKNFYNDYITNEPKEGYTGDSLYVLEISNTSGIIFIKYTRAADASWNYTSDSSLAPDVGKWYAVSYKDLKEDSVKLSGASKATGVTSCDTLEEAKEEFVENGYFSYYDDFVRQ